MKDEQFYEVYEQIKYLTGCYDDDARSCAEILLDNLGYRKSEWISVEDRLPERHSRVLCYHKYEPESPDVICENTYYGRKSDGHLWLSDGDKVTHWMPLPIPPRPKDTDLNHMYDIDNNLNTITQAIDEINLLETILKADEYPDSVYNSFRDEVCSDCLDYLSQKCLASKVDIVECPEFYD